MKRTLFRAGIVVSALAILVVGTPSTSHAEPWDDFDVGGVIDDLSVLTEVGVWDQQDAPPASVLETPETNQEGAIPEASAATLQSQSGSGLPTGLPAAGGGNPSPPSALVIAVVAAAFAAAGASLLAEGRTLGERRKL